MGRILLVEDERPVRAMLRHILTDAGYDVSDTAHSETAYYQVSGHNVDLVISDVVLPGQGGIALLLALRRSFPNLPLVAIAGKDREVIQAQLDVVGLRHRVWLLKKPFTRDELVATVKAALPG